MHRDNFRLYVFYLGILLTIIGLPFSRALISFGQVALGALFLFDKNLISKLKIFVKNKIAMSFISIYVLWWLGMLYTSDIQYGLFDLRTKLPLLIFPLVFVTEPRLSYKAFLTFILLFSATVIASLSTSLYIYYVNHLSDYREAFVFVSHIRLSLMALISIISLSYIAFNEKYFALIIRALMLLGVLFLIIVQFIFSMLSGVIILIFIVVVFFVRMLFSNISRAKAVMGIVVIMMLFIGFVYIVFNIVDKYNDVSAIDLEQLDTVTALGNKYNHKPFDYQIENGNYIGIYVQWGEMNTAWHKRSKLDFDGYDKRNQPLRFTVLRYLSSKGLRKDAAGIASLTDTDIQNIEKGIANFEYAKRISFKKRIYKLIWQYNIYKANDESLVSGNTILQRIELWSVATELISENPIFGIGTGDINKAYADILEQKHSSLAGMGLRSHNQYLNAFVSMGIIGFIVFLFSLFYPAYLAKANENPFLFYFIIIIATSMLWEDTIESQVGVSVYAFLYMFFIFADKGNLTQIKKDQ
ncbi:MAG: hypothetical protein B6I18_05380 [Bacteroidetes bacterium 4572_112]|nr:MAG: hypothetical protein B6I18_05380 [Bacteroidetes bacterium 4572_112]